MNITSEVSKVFAMSLRGRNAAPLMTSASCNKKTQPSSSGPQPQTTAQMSRWESAYTGDENHPSTERQTQNIQRQSAHNRLASQPAEIGVPTVRSLSPVKGFPHVNLIQKTRRMAKINDIASLYHSTCCRRESSDLNGNFAVTQVKPPKHLLSKVEIVQTQDGPVFATVSDCMPFLIHSSDEM